MDRVIGRLEKPFDLALSIKGPHLTSPFIACGRPF
jgi:hypothetical protein